VKPQGSFLYDKEQNVGEISNHKNKQKTQKNEKKPENRIQKAPTGQLNKNQELKKN